MLVITIMITILNIIIDAIAVIRILRLNSAIAAGIVPRLVPGFTNKVHLSMVCPPQYGPNIKQYT